MPTLLHKRNAVSGKIPLAGEILAGELAINTADGRVYTKLDSGVIVEVTLPIFNTLAFGADPTGATDSSSAIQAAIAKAEAAAVDGGAGVYSPPGRYKVSSGFGIEEENVRFFGAGRSTIFMPSTALTPMIYVGPSSGALTANAGNVLSDFMVDLTNTNTTGIHWRRWGQIGINRNIHFVNPGATAIGITTSDNTIVNEVEFYGINWWNDPATKEGTAIKINCNNCRVWSSTIIGAAVAIDVATANSISAFSVIGSRITDNTYGVRVGNLGTQSGFGINILDTRFESNITRDIDVQGTSGTFRWWGVFVRGCYLTRGGSQTLGGGINLKNTNGVTLDTLTFKDWVDSGTIVVDGGTNSNFHARNLISAQGTTQTILPTTLSQKDFRIPTTLHVGEGTQAPSQGNSPIYAARAGETAIVARDTNNSAEAMLYTGGSAVRVGARTNHNASLIANNTNQITARSDGRVFVENGAFGIPDGISTPATESGKAQLFVDSADGDLKVRFGDGTVKTIVVDT